MAAPAYEFIANGPISIGGVLGYSEGDLVPASVVDAHGLAELVSPRPVADTDQVPADSRVDDDSTGDAPFGAADDLIPNDSKA